MHWKWRNRMRKAITKIVDGGIVSDDIVRRFQLRPFCSLNDSGSYTSKFVGIVMTQAETLVSCPKHLGYSGEDDVELIIGCLMKASKYIGVDSNDLLSNIPYKSYLNVLDYYNKYGLYRNNNKTYYKGYG